MGEVVKLDTYRSVADVAADQRRAEYRVEAEKAYNTLSLWRKTHIDAGGRYRLGFETREGWSGHLPFYLFKCYSCKNIAKSYTQGHRGYLTCSSCGRNNGFILWWHAWTILQCWYNRRFRSHSTPTREEK